MLTCLKHDSHSGPVNVFKSCTSKERCKHVTALVRTYFSNDPMVECKFHAKYTDNLLPVCVDRWPIVRCPVKWDTIQDSIVLNIAAMSHSPRPTIERFAPSVCAVYASNRAIESILFHSVATIHHRHCHHRCHSTLDIQRWNYLNSPNCHRCHCCHHCCCRYSNAIVHVVWTMIFDWHWFDHDATTCVHSMVHSYLDCRHSMRPQQMFVCI